MIFNDTQTLQRAWWQTPLLSLVLLIGAGMFWLLATVPLRWDQQAVLGAACLVLAVAIKKLWRSNVGTLVLSAISVFSTLRYAYYRVSETYNYLSVNWSEARFLDLFFVFTLLGAELYAFVILFLGFFQTARPLNRHPEPLPGDPQAWPRVDIYIPTYNESLDVVRSTVLAAMNMDWPSESMKVYILDDGRRSEFREFAEAVGCGYMIRPDNKHAKAGNINHALRKTDGEYIVIFDCDHIPTRSFLQVAMGWFLKDPKLGMLQTPHHFYSPDPFERNLNIFRKVPNEGSLFYGVIQDGSDFWNAAFFCGSCAVLRRTAIQEIGGIAVETVTEDAHTSLRMQRRGWNTAYLRFPQAGGLATGSLAAHIGQRIRWARGMIQILRTDNPLFGKGLKLPQRLCYLNSTLHFLYAIPRLLFLTSPLVYLLLGYSNIYGYGRAILAYALPHLALSIVANSRVQGRYRYSFWNEVYETVLAPYILLPTTVALISPKHGKFNVTSKSDQIDEDYFDWKLAAPYVLLLLLNVIGITLGILRMASHAGSRETLSLNVMWCALNTVVLGAATAIAREAKQRRNSVRIGARISVSILNANGLEIHTNTVDISRGGFSVLNAHLLAVETGERITAIFHTGGEDYFIPGIMIESNTKAARFGFTALTLEQEDQLVRVIFGRADAWLNWRSDKNNDRPLLSLLSIIGISLQGFSAIATGIFDLLRRNSSVSGESAETSVARNPALPSVGLAMGALLLGSLWPVHAQAQQLASLIPPITPVVAPASQFNDSYDLAALGHKDNLMLKGSDARASLSFGIPVTKVVTTAKLQINYRASAALAPKLSVLNVLLNGSAVGSIPIEDLSDPDSNASAELELPSDLLTGDNFLTFELKGHCAPGCLGGTPASLWLRLERATQIRLSGSVLAIANNLRLLPAPFFDGTSQRTVSVPIAFAETPDVQTLEASGVISSWLGTLADFRGIHFPVSVGTLPPGNVIVFASKRSGFLADGSLGALNGPAIALHDNPSDPYGKILLITGDTGEQILAAARALASGRFPRDGDSAELGNVTLPPVRSSYDAPRWMNANSEGLSLEDQHVFGNGSANLYFRLPPDISFGEQRFVPFRLNYRLFHWSSEASGELRIKLNGAYVAFRRISQNADAGKQTTIIGLPADQLFPGNTLSVEFQLNEGRHSLGRNDPEESVLRDSKLDISKFSHYVEMPRLDLFANAGFPFTKYADLSETAVVMPRDPSPQQTSLYLTLLGFFGARTGYPALRVTVIDSEHAAEAASKHLLILGNSADTSSGMLTATGPARLEHGAIQIFSENSLLSRLPWTRGAMQTRQAQDILLSDPAPAGFISEFASPYNAQNTAISFQVLDPHQFSAIEDFFAENTRLYEIYGNLSLLQDRQFHSFVLKSNVYAYGNLRWDDRWRAWMRRNYWTIPIFLLFLSVVLCFQLNSWLEFRAKLRLQAQA